MGIVVRGLRTGKGEVRGEEGGVNYMRSSVCFPAGRIIRGNPDIIKLFDEVIEYVQGAK